MTLRTVTQNSGLIVLVKYITPFPKVSHMIWSTHLRRIFSRVLCWHDIIAGNIVKPIIISTSGKIVKSMAMQFSLNPAIQQKYHPEASLILGD